MDGLYAKFTENNVALSMVSMLSDTDLNDLGVVTIGDQIRLAEAVKGDTNVRNVDQGL